MNINLNFEKVKKQNLDFFNDEKLNNIFKSCFFNTIDTTLKFDDDGSVFVLTGDIPAMWLRDSSCQVLQYLYFTDDENVCNLIKGILKRQFMYIHKDPYANAFMFSNQDVSEWKDIVETDSMNPIVWERKFELDSLCFPLFLASKYYERTNDISVFDGDFINALDEIIKVVEKERHHTRLSSYYYTQFGITVGKNTDEEGEKGLVWSGYRPSDDPCMYNYHIPDNMFLVSVYSKLIPVLERIGCFSKANMLKKTIEELVPLIEEYGIKEELGYGRIYISETDCKNSYSKNDDANFPSLLSIPFLEYPYIDEEIYKNTRKYILSKNNVYYHEGKVLKGIGSPHTPGNRVWPLAIAMQGLTSNNKDEIKDCFNMLISSSLSDLLMHESVDVDNPEVYTRPWFAWASSMFALFVLKKQDDLR